MRRAPLTNAFFRPEEKHVASGENDIVPPLGRGNEAMKKPAARWRTFQADLQCERFTGLFAPRMNPPLSMQSRRYTECIPGAVSEVLRLIDDYDVLGRHT